MSRRNMHVVVFLSWTRLERFTNSHHQKISLNNSQCPFPSLCISFLGSWLLSKRDGVQVKRHTCAEEPTRGFCPLVFMAIVSLLTMGNSFLLCSLIIIPVIMLSLWWCLRKEMINMNIKRVISLRGSSANSCLDSCIYRSLWIEVFPDLKDYLLRIEFEKRSIRFYWIRIYLVQYSWASRTSPISSILFW